MNTTALSEAAGLSRMTLHRIERGEPTVTMGAYINAMTVLGLQFDIHTAADLPAARGADFHPGFIPARIRLDHYPQLKQLAWQVHGTDYLTPVEAFGIYERNVRHVDLRALEPHERTLIEALGLVLPDAKRHV